MLRARSSDNDFRQRERSLSLDHKGRKEKKKGRWLERDREREWNETKGKERREGKCSSSESGHVHCSALILESVVALCNASIGGSRADPNVYLSTSAPPRARVCLRARSRERERERERDAVKKARDRKGLADLDRWTGRDLRPRWSGLDCFDVYRVAPRRSLARSRCFDDCATFGGSSPMQTSHECFSRDFSILSRSTFRFLSLSLFLLE